MSDSLGTWRKRKCNSYLTLSFYSRILLEYLRYSAYFIQKYVRYVCIFLHQLLLHTRNHIKIWWQSSSKQQNIECRLQPKARRNNGFDVTRKYFQTKLMHFGYNKTTQPKYVRRNIYSSHNVLQNKISVKSIICAICKSISRFFIVKVEFVFYFIVMHLTIQRGCAICTF